MIFFFFSLVNHNVDKSTENLYERPAASLLRIKLTYVLVCLEGF